MRRSFIFLTMIVFPFIIGVSCKEEDPAAEINPLTAKAGNDRQAITGAVVQLDGSASKDTEGGNFSYLWTLKSKPAGSLATLKQENTATPEFTPDKPGVFVLELTISRAQWNSKDEVQITVSGESIPQMVEISEDITSDLVLEDVFTDDWTKTDYLVTTSIGLEAKLTIKPGVKVAFAKDAVFTVRSTGTVVSEGGTTEESRIYLTGKTETTGFWGGIVFQSGSVNNTMIYTSLAFAGANPSQQPFAAGVFAESGSKIKIEHSFFTDNSGFGIYVSPDAELATFVSNYLKAGPDEEYTIALPAVEVAKISADCQFWDGSILVNTASLSEGIKHEWETFNYTLTKGLNIINGTGLQLYGGTQLRIAQDQKIAAQNGGYIRADGTEARPVLFKGEEEVSGYWKGIFIENSGNNPSRLSYASIWNAGSSPLAGNQPASVHLGQQGKAAINHTSVNQGGGDGIEATSSGAVLLSFTANSIREHQGYPMAVSTSNVAVIDPLTYFINNARNQVRIDGNYPLASDQETVWSGFAQDNMSYHVKGLSKDLVVWSGLKMAEGVVLEMEPESRIVVEDANNRQGYLHLAGTAAKNVTIRSANNNPGSWYGITISSANAKNRFEYANVLHGGKTVDNSFSANITVDNSPEGTLTIVNSTVGYSGQHGISVVKEKRGNLAYSNLIFVGIPEMDIYAW
jgi:hypothetical protein